MASETLYLSVFCYNSEEGAEFELCACDTICNSFEVHIQLIGNTLSSTGTHADSNGWVWGFANPDATVETSAQVKGAGCNGCDSQADNIDYMLMNKFFP